MSDSQLLTIAFAAVLTMLTVLVGILISDGRLSDTNSRIPAVNSRMADLREHMDSRFHHMRDTWRAELSRVQEVLDGRLKHLEERG